MDQKEGWDIHKLNQQMIEMLKIDCKATAEKIETSSFARWTEEHKKFVDILGDVMMRLAYDAMLLHCTTVSSGTRAAGETVSESGTSAKGLIGQDFEDYLTETIGGDGSFSVGGREFDGAVGSRWWEAKSGNYWSMLEENSSKLAKFKSDMGARLRIATENGATYELFSNTPIPESIKQWLTKKGIPFTELLD